MFERYTERARRTLFHARYEASQLGSQAMEPEHLLLGLIQEPSGPAHIAFSGARVRLDKIRQDIEGKTDASRDDADVCRNAAERRTETCTTVCGCGS
jgi:ATP-dependent Clp protease ATP-binding subunit ClpA